MSAHPRFSPEEWTAKYPLAAHVAASPRPDEFDPYQRSFVAGPKSLTLDQQMRAALWPDIEMRGGFPSDVFVWAWGEPPQPYLTKIGGLPFLPKNLQWPHDDAGRPMHFIAQFNFFDSQDIVPDLPGDVLLIFSPEFPGQNESAFGYPFDSGWLDVENSVFLFADSTSPAMRTADEMPATKLNLWPLHGHIYRSSDHPDLYDEYVVPHISVVGGKQVDPPAVLCGTKIGGVPVWEQDPPDWLQEHPNRRFLCQLMSDRAEVEKEDAYVGRTDPICERGKRRHRRLVIADVGSMCLFWDSVQIYAEVQGG